MSTSTLSPTTRSSRTAQSASSLRYQWDLALQRCLGSLSLYRDEVDKIVSITTQTQVEMQLQDLQQKNDSVAVLRGLTLIEPSLVHYEILLVYVSDGLGDDIDLFKLWGFMSVLIQVAIQERNALPRIASMIKSLGQSIDLFNAYCEGAAHIDQSLGAGLGVLIDLITFFTQALDFFHTHSTPVALSDEDAWRKLTRIYKSAFTEIESSFQRIEKLAQLAKFNAHDSDFSKLREFLSLSQSSSVSSSTGDEQATLPCVILPPTLNTRCFDRDQTLVEIDSYFQSKSNERAFHSLALWGLGGVGKSHVALKYAQSKFVDFDAIFWIASEGPIALAESFSKIAIRLQLPNIFEQNHEENRVAVLNWLQKTTCRWLLIFDNAKDPNSLLQYWPVASNGLALITTRNHSLAFQPADIGIEVLSFETDAGSDFLLHLLSLDAAKDLSQTEAKSAFDLSSRLSGHALAISQMAGLIHRRMWSIEEFLDVYDQNEREIQGTESGNSLATVWRLSFKSLDAASLGFLGILSYISPDSIPQLLFEQSKLEPELEVYQNKLKFSEIQETLLNLALIRRDKSSKTFSLHRLVQLQFRFYMTIDGRKQNFQNASKLLFEAFPQRNADKGQFYDRWAVCRLYFQHVLSLKDQYKKARAETEPLKSCWEFCWVLLNCGRYMIEIASFPELEDVAEVAKEAVESLQSEKKDDELIARMYNLLGQMWAHRGEFRVAEGYLKQSLDVRNQQKPTDLEQKSWANNDIALSISSLNRHQEALHYYEVAEKLRADAGGLLEFGGIGDQNIGRTFKFLGRLDDANTRFHKIWEQFGKTTNWLQIAYTQSEIAAVLRIKGKLDLAWEGYIAAQQAWLGGSKMHTHHFNSICMYKLGCVALDQGKVEKATNLLRQALVVAKVRFSVMPGQYARVLFKLSEALRRDPTQLQEADENRDEAEAILAQQRIKLGYKEGQNAEEYSKTGEQAYDSLVFLLWR